MERMNNFKLPKNLKEAAAINCRCTSIPPVELIKHGAKGFVGGIDPPDHELYDFSNGEGYDLFVRLAEDLRREKIIHRSMIYEQQKEKTMKCKYKEKALCPDFKPGNYGLECENMDSSNQCYFVAERIPDGKSQCAYDPDLKSDIMKYFAYSHLPEKLQNVSALFHDLAVTITHLACNDEREKAVALRKLLESKDAAVRSML